MLLMNFSSLQSFCCTFSGYSCKRVTYIYWCCNVLFLLFRLKPRYTTSQGQGRSSRRWRPRKKWGMKSNLFHLANQKYLPLANNKTRDRHFNFKLTEITSVNERLITPRSRRHLYIYNITSNPKHYLVETSHLTIHFSREVWDQKVENSQVVESFLWEGKRAHTPKVIVHIPT